MKYELTTTVQIVNSIRLYQIRAVEGGELGGWIESEKNLSQEGTCWVSGNALIYGNAQVSGGAWVSGYERRSES